MSDQADILRGLMQQRSSRQADQKPSSPKRRAFSIAVTSGKGGVGKSNLALNLSIALAQQGASVCLFDANLGLGSIELLCGLNGYWNLSHVVTGARRLDDIVLAGPAGVAVIPGASGLAGLADCPIAAQQDLLAQLDPLEQEHDFLVFDTGAGIHQAIRRFVATADLPLIVTTPEPTALADAYATLKALSPSRDGTIAVVVNQTQSEAQAGAVLDRLRQTSRAFLRISVEALGSVPYDAAVAQSVAARAPLLLSAPRSEAAQAIARVALRVQTFANARPVRQPLFRPKSPAASLAAA